MKETDTTFGPAGRALLLVSVLFTITVLIAVASAPSAPQWWDTTWHYRVTLQINNTDYSRTSWPIEQDINFTELLLQRGLNTTFDINSTRVIEVNSTQGFVSEMTSQFDTVSGFNVSTNAAGTIVFIMNGTTVANETRYFDIYFDTLENGPKNATAYSTLLNYSWDGEEAIIRNANFSWRIDTIRGENTSGIYNVSDLESGITIFSTLASARTKEYVQYWNGTDNLTFDFRNNATFRAGPVRIIMEQTGDEVLWNNSFAKTNSGMMTKKYVFYDLHFDDSPYSYTNWIRVKQNFTNIGASSINRSSNTSGALAFELNVQGANGYTIFFGNNTNPGSWSGATTATKGVGLLVENQTGTSNYYASNYSLVDGDSSSAGRIGVSLSDTEIPSGESIYEDTIMQFGWDFYYDGNLLGLRNAAANPPIITVSGLDAIGYELTASTNYTAYNRNETVLIFGNVTRDQNNITSVMNATIDMGTAGTSDDIVLELYDDGDAAHGDGAAGDLLFSNYLNVTENSTVAEWNVTIRAYDSFGVLLNVSSAQFNVTDEYNITLIMDSENLFVDSLANATLTLMNSRRDTYIPGATIACEYNSTPVTDITDYNNGTYRINFTAPSTTGGYILNCSASKANNSAADSYFFWTETAETGMTASTVPLNYTTSNVSLYTSESFEISANATDVGGAKARDVSFNLTLPQNLSANATGDTCGNVTIGSSCIRLFNITVANSTLPGNYTFNVTAYWTNPDASTNSTNTTFTVFVLSNPLMAVLEDNVSGVVGDGISKIIGNFTVFSFGNDNATNITFNHTGLDNFTINFTPVNVSYVRFGTNSSVSINVSVPWYTAPGNYSGTINVSSPDGGWDIIGLNITVPSQTGMELSISPSNHTSANITLYAYDFFNISVNGTNTGPANARDVNFTLSLPQNISANSTFLQCGNVTDASSCTEMFNVTVANSTLPGNYTLNISMSWQNPDATINSTNASFTVYVLQNSRIDAVEANISGTVSDGNSSVLGNFTVRSFGNTNATNITFDVTGGLSNFTITFVPQNMSSIGLNESMSVSVNVSVPMYHASGNYSGTINVSSPDGGWDAITINVTVPRRLAWTVSSTFCTAIESYMNGTICTINLTNTGNDFLNFTVSPAWFNYTYPNETYFNVTSSKSHYFDLMYNISNTTKDDYTAAFNITSQQPGALPSYIGINTYITASSAPVIYLQISPSEAEQLTNIEIFANVTDRSATGINYTAINITLPNSTVEAFNMTRIILSGNVSQWYFNYSGNMSGFNATGNSSYNYTGNTVLRGNYSFTAYSQDNLFNDTGTKSSYFTIYAKLIATLTLGATEYYPGQTGSIYYNLTEAQGIPLSEANVSFALYVPSLDLYLPSPDPDTVHTTSLNGLVTLIPAFTLASDSPSGTYNLTANATYYDNVTNRSLNVLSNKGLAVQSGSGGGGGGGGLDVNIETAVVWYPQNILSFDAWFTLYGNVTDPDNFTISVQHAITRTTLFTINQNDTTKDDTGRYHYLYALSSSTPTGPYIAILNATRKGYVNNWIKSFRIASAGPYDLGLNLLQSEVERPGDLEFEVTIVNNGEAGQDVNLQYWVTFDNQTWDNQNEVYFTPAHTTSTITRSVHVFSGQPLGITTLNVRMYYDQYQPSILANATFNVIESEITIPPPPEAPPWAGSGGGGSGIVNETTQIVRVPVIRPANRTQEEEAASVIQILNYPRQVNIIRGWTDIQSVEVKNNGDASVKNLTLGFSGIPPSWVRITPAVANNIPSQNSTIFLLEFKIPKTAEPGEYGYTISARSGTGSDDAVGKLSIFSSLEDLVKNDIKNIKIDLQKLQDDTDFAGRIGKKVDAVRLIIEDARLEIKRAEDNVNLGDYDNALANTQTASNLIKRGRQLLEKATAPPATEKPATSIWYIGLLSIILLLIIGAIILIILKKRGKVIAIMPHFPRLHAKEGKPVEASGGEDITAEKERLSRMNALLEEELKEGTLTQSVYDELKKRNDEKLAKLAKKT